MKPLPTPSKGHVGWFRGLYGIRREVYVYGGQVHIAPESNVIDLDTGCRFGRWEGPERNLPYILEHAGERIPEGGAA